MINLLEIRKEKKLDFVFPALGSTKRFNDNAAVFINLYNQEMLVSSWVDHILHQFKNNYSAILLQKGLTTTELIGLILSL